MTTVLVTGGTGGLGRELVPRLQRDGHQVRVMSRSASPKYRHVEWAQADLKTGSGVAQAVQGVDVIIHAASSAFRDEHAVDVLGTQRLLEHAPGVQNFVYISIVGIDRFPTFSYYRHKLMAERLIENSSIPWTILRATQFHTLIDLLLHVSARLPVMLLPTDFQTQVVDAGEVADVLVRHTPAAAGRLPDMGGPEVLRLGEMAAVWRKARGIRKPVVHLPVPGQTARNFRQGYNLTPNRQGRITWAEWVRRQYHGEAPEAARPRHEMVP
ncbi:MAG: NAD(P)H-binding protein [Chloroflexi bacterium]|nr:NAD(P)H-binding protein [Chloroflexota bacterium]